MLMRHGYAGRARAQQHMRATDEHYGVERRVSLAKSPGLPDNPLKAKVSEDT